jgi:hypothetical protein
MESAVFSRENPLAPNRGTNLPTEIACYSLPYGGLGFASHVLTYYTILILGLGRKPLWPVKHVKYGIFGLTLAGVGLLAGFILSTITMVRCRNHWQLLALATWKFSMSLFNGIVGFRVAYLNFRQRKENGTTVRIEKMGPYPKVYFWFGICACVFLLCTSNILILDDVQTFRE